MNLFGIIILLSGSIFFCMWLRSEFKGVRRQRITFGVLALVTLTAVTFFATYIVNQLNYNAWYGFATKDLIDETIRGIESGANEMVLQELKQFQDSYQPTYENRAKYVTLANEAANRIKEQNSQPNATPNPSGPVR